MEKPKLQLKVIINGFKNWIAKRREEKEVLKNRIILIDGTEEILMQIRKEMLSRSLNLVALRFSVSLFKVIFSKELDYAFTLTNSVDKSTTISLFYLLEIYMALKAFIYVARMLILLVEYIWYLSTDYNALAIYVDKNGTLKSAESSLANNDLITPSIESEDRKE